MQKKIVITVIMLIFALVKLNSIYAASYEWNIGGLRQMDYDAIEAEEVEIELSFYCGVDNAMEGGAKSAAGKTLVYGNLANNYYTGIKSINGGKSWELLNNGYKLGTNVYIKDIGLFTIEDRGGSSDFNKTNRMDLFVARKEGETDAQWEKRTNSYGHQKVKAKIIKNGSERNWTWPSGSSAATTKPTFESTTTGVGLNSKIIYTSTKSITTTGPKPVHITTNCKDASEEYWNKTTVVTGTDMDGAYNSGLSSPEVSIDFDSSGVPAEVLSGSSKDKFNWLFDGNGGMAYNTTEAAILKYMITIDVPVINEKGVETTKKLTVHKKIAGDIVKIFTEIKQGGFKIRNYDTGAYNWRGGQKIGSSGLYSMHCLGIAVDINWDSNYAIRINTGVVEAGKHWKPGVDEFSMPADGIVVKTFKKYGWKWGGDWKTYKDYMHFSLTGN